TDLRALKPSDLLIGHQVLGHPLTGFDRGPDPAGAAESQPRPVPEHRVASEDVSQRLNGHAPLAQGEGLFHFLGACHQGGPNEGRAQGEDLASLGQCNAPQLKTFLLARARDVVKAEAGSHRLWKDLWMLLLHLFEVLTILGQVSETSLRLGFTL